MKTIAVIPARGGSQRIPGKNIRDFYGKPILAYSIETARESGLFDRIFVSTDSISIVETANKYGAEAVIRDEEMAHNDVGTWEVTKHVAEQLELELDDLICCIYPTSPLMSVDDLRRGHLYMQSLEISHAISVGYPPLQDAAQFYWSWVDALYLGVPYFDVSTGLVPIENKRVCDINVEADWIKAEAMYIDLQEKQ